MNIILQFFFGVLPVKSAQPDIAGAPLADIQQALRHGLEGCKGTRTQRLHYKIDFARTPADLWALRSDLHQCIAQVHTESVAAQRINDMASIFQGWVPAAQLTKIQPDLRPSSD